jgi:hypothetical protein
MPGPGLEAGVGVEGEAKNMPGLEPRASCLISCSYTTFHRSLSSGEGLKKQAPSISLPTSNFSLLQHFVTNTLRLGTACQRLLHGLLRLRPMSQDRFQSQNQMVYS